LPFIPECAILILEKQSISADQGYKRVEREGARSIMLRSFIAIETPAEMQGAIAESTASLKKALPKNLIRWVAPQNVHLTLKFLGDVSPASLERLAETLKVEVTSHRMFCISVGGLGIFPNPRRARVIWIGLVTPPALETLQRGVESAAARLGYSPEERPFSAHLTIGRVGQNVSAADSQHIRSVLEATKVGVLGTVRVEAVHIFKSDLQSGGPIYTHLYTFPMRSME
jgi:2'-5' RNA ligase